MTANRLKDLQRYIHRLNPEILGLEHAGLPIITDLPQGVWNFNYLVEMGGRKFVFKMYAPGSSHVEGMTGNSGPIEYQALKLVEPLNLAPHPLHFEAAGQDNPYPVLVYQYVEGNWITFTPQTITAAAHLYFRLHSLPEAAASSFLRIRDEDPASILESLEVNLRTFEQRPEAPGEYTAAFRRFLHRADRRMSALDCPKSPALLIHADPVPSNIIVGEKMYLIDWQTPMLGDPAFDLWAFTSRAFSLWDSPTAPGPELKQLFLNAYLDDCRDPGLLDRLAAKEPLYQLQYGLHCASRHLDFKTGRLGRDLVMGREANFEKYDRITRVVLEDLEELLT